MEFYQLSLTLSFVIAIVLTLGEVAWSFWKRDHGYTWGDSLGNLSTVVFYHLTKGIFFKAVFLSLLAWVGQSALLHWEPNEAWAWLLCFLVLDFFYYWDHRLSHTVRIFWCFHSVHHSSRHYNFSVAPRLSAFEDLFRWWYFVPAALLGFPTLMILTVSLLHRMYGFFLHTRYVGKLGFLECILVTPSQHRVHHGRNPQYLDKNYGEVLCLWDRLFGTFEPEVEPVDYGLVQQLNSNNPWTIQFDGFQKLWFDLKRASSWKRRLHLVFAKP